MFTLFKALSLISSDYAFNWLNVKALVETSEENISSVICYVSHVVETTEAFTDICLH